jgi:hypothetical protein
VTNAASTAAAMKANTTIFLIGSLHLLGGQLASSAPSVCEPSNASGILQVFLGVLQFFQRVFSGAGYCWRVHVEFSCYLVVAEPLHCELQNLFFSFGEAHFCNQS